MKNYREIIKSVSLLVIVAVLFLITAKFVIPKASSQTAVISKLKKDQNTLDQKIKLLSAIKDTLDQDVNFVTIALPNTNNTLVAISQIRNKALENGLIFGSLKSGAEVKDLSGLMRSEITFQVNGPKGQIVNFINSIPTIAPILITEKVKITEANEITRADISVKSFWSEYPKSLPSTAQNLSDLTEKEVKILEEISTLTPPTFSVSSPNVGSERPDPFSQ